MGFLRWLTIFNLGLTQHELSHATQSAYIPLGGHKVINFFGITPMDNPNNCVPSQFTSNQKLKKNDVISTEISAHYWNYPGQILRTISLGPMTSIYKELHAVADEVFSNYQKFTKRRNTCFRNHRGFKNY